MLYLTTFNDKVIGRVHIVVVTSMLCVVMFDKTSKSLILILQQNKKILIVKNKTTMPRPLGMCLHLFLHMLVVICDPSIHFLIYF